MTSRILLVTGSRALDGSTEEQTARAMLRAFIEQFAPGFVVAGDARGPDEWAVDIASSNGATLPHVRIYGLDGWVKSADSKDVRRWTTAEKFSPLDRNAAMVREVAVQYAKGAFVRVLGLEAAWSATKGTAHTITAARRAGLSVTRITFERIEER